MNFNTFCVPTFFLHNYIRSTKNHRKVLHIVLPLPVFTQILNPISGNVFSIKIWIVPFYNLIPCVELAKKDFFNKSFFRCNEKISAFQAKQVHWVAIYPKCQSRWKAWIAIKGLSNRRDWYLSWHFVPLLLSMAESH